MFLYMYIEEQAHRKICEHIIQLALWFNRKCAAMISNTNQTHHNWFKQTESNYKFPVEQ